MPQPNPTSNESALARAVEVVASLRDTAGRGEQIEQAAARLAESAEAHAASGEQVRSSLEQVAEELAQTSNMTIDFCLERCQKFGYPAAGVEYGRQCVCGDFGAVESRGEFHARRHACIAAGVQVAEVVRDLGLVDGADGLQSSLRELGACFRAEAAGTRPTPVG